MSPLLSSQKPFGGNQDLTQISFHCSMIRFGEEADGYVDK